MAKETPPKKERNKKLVEFRKQGTSFRTLGLIFHITKQRAKQVYDKEMKKRKGLDKGA